MDGEQTVAAVKKVVECFSDGFEFSDIVKSIRTTVEIAETITDLDGAQKKQFVIDVIRQGYKEVNPNIPWVPEPFETWVEDYVLKHLVPAVIELIVDATKGKVKVNQ